MLVHRERVRDLLTTCGKVVVPEKCHLFQKRPLGAHQFCHPDVLHHFDIDNALIVCKNHRVPVRHIRSFLVIQQKVDRPCEAVLTVIFEFRLACAEAKTP